MRHKWEYLTGNTWQCERCGMLRHVVQLPSNRAGYVEADVYSSDKRGKLVQAQSQSASVRIALAGRNVAAYVTVQH